MSRLTSPSANGQRTVEQYAQAAAAAAQNVAPSSTGGGSLGAAATAPPSSASGAPSSTASTQPSAGIEARGDVRWGLLSLGMAVAGVFGGLLI